MALLPTGRPGPGGLLGEQPRRSGGAGNLLLGAGLGLLGQGPSYMPISPFQGLASGLQLGMGLNQDARRGDLAEERIAMERQRYAAAQAEREREAQARGNAQDAWRDVVNNVPPEVTAQWAGAERLGNLPPELGMKFLAPGMKPAADPMAKFNAYAEMGPEDQAKYRAYVEATRTPAMSLSLDGGGGMKSRAATPADYIAMSMAPDSTGYMVSGTGEFKPIPGTEARTKEAARAELLELIDRYGAMGDKVGTLDSLSGIETVDKETARKMRRSIAHAIARFKQPTGILTDKEIAEEEKGIPDLFGGLDMLRAKDRIAGLRSIYAPYAPDAPPAATATPGATDGAASATPPLPPGFEIIP